MKKNLILLTGIVFLMAVLAASGCKQGSTPTNGNDTTTAYPFFMPPSHDSTIVDIFLKDTVIGEEMHLLMSDSRKPHNAVIDSLITIVYPGDTVNFYRGQNSKVKEVTKVELVLPIFPIHSEDIRVDHLLYTLIIDTIAPGDTIAKYGIWFVVKPDSTIYDIDPYLRIPNLDE